MARLISNTVMRGLLSVSRSADSKVASTGYMFPQGMRFSTSGDSDTHNDFKPTSNLDSSDISMKEIVEKDVKDNPVVIYMKGTLNAPRCGFSELAVKVLQQYDVPIAARNILGNPLLKQGVKDFSDLPTFPQVFVRGKLFGGSDRLLYSHRNGSLKRYMDSIGTEEDPKNPLPLFI